MFLCLTVLPLLSLLVVLLAVGALLCAAAVLLSARSLLRPPRMTDGKAVYLLRRLSPEDIGLRYEQTSFTVRDEKTGEALKLAAWWIPATDDARGGGRCVVLLHGYADAKVGAIAWAPVWHALGFHILALDLRAHGESDGVLSTAGFRERHDVAQVLDQLRPQRPAETRQIILFGVSLGAAVALAVAADARGRSQVQSSPSSNGDAESREAGAVAGVVLESPYADFAHAAAVHMDRLGLPAGPGGLLHRWAVRLAERWSGADFALVRPVDLLAHVPVPVMAILPAADPYLPPRDAALFESVLSTRPRACGADACWRADAGHLMAVVAEPEEYQRRLREFVSAALHDAAAPFTQTLQQPFRTGKQ
jgi:pimeloyl-ACP methyl ester carboxylesterase